jgi:DNA-binding NtrC family response regulator
MTARALIVDDDKDFLETLAKRMQKRGIKVFAAEPATVAMKLLEKESYDAVLIDLMMPEMGGIEALQIIRKKFPEIKVLIISEHPSIARRVEALKLRATDFIPKPIDFDYLMEMVKQV